MHVWKNSRASMHLWKRRLIVTGADFEMVIHRGGRHCGRVRWQVEAPPSVVACKCNCTDCSMRGNTHFIVPATKFKLIGESEQSLTTYTFGTHSAKHTLSKNRGITSFYVPCSNPDGFVVTMMCVDAGTLSHIEIRPFDGSNWEKSYEETSVSSCSKLDAATPK